MVRRILIGIAGGSGSGKTLVARTIVRELGSDRVVVIDQDSYYRNLEADPDVRFIRRLRRDLVERGRSVDSIIRQYEESVRPMHMQFVEPSKRYADLIIPEGGHNAVAIDLVKTKIRELLRERGVETVPAV